ncbi:dTDP-glucose 4,6-dehydratase [Marinobacter sp. NFXS9]|uniref:dTDP-glucose 4,6-dehydratase n=1 Tax=Marinobacter sp. NFXS9 TaxID=2818433 RepID=UPI0032DEAD48
MILVTGGCGFIGTNFIRLWLAEKNEPVVNVDALTYAGNAENLSDIQDNPDYYFEQVDICDASAIADVLKRYRPRAILHFAAESHVDRSITSPEAFLQTNVMGTFNLLHSALAMWNTQGQPDGFRFLHVSTDEVYGSLGKRDPAFTEQHRYQPNSPYSASKAASDHLVRAWHHTYDLPVLTTNCSNNYGPYQFPEKLIPLMIERGLSGESLPVYGDGNNVRDWLYVEDHCHAIMAVLEKGTPGETYNIGGNEERTNLDVVENLTNVLQMMKPREGGYRELIRFVKDRPGHDRRYAINPTHIRDQLNWYPQIDFCEGLRRTVDWYLSNRTWVDRVKSGEYRHWLDHQYRS